MKYYILILFVSASILCSCSNEEGEITTRSIELTSEECVGIPKPSDTFVFPVRPGTEKWKKLHDKGLDAVYEALQMPSVMLKTISTNGLIYTYFDCPYTYEPSLAANYSDVVSSHFINPEYAMNFCTELQKRTDAASCLTKMLSQVNPLDCGNSSRVFTTIHLMLTIPKIQQQLDLNEKKELARIAISKAEEIGYGLEKIAISNYLLAKIMQAADYRDFITILSSDSDLNYFVERGSIIMKEESGKIIADYARKFVGMDNNSNN